MNAKKAKALRRAAREVAAATGVPEQDVYLRNVRTGTVRAGKCVRGLTRHLKKQVAAGKIRITPNRGPTPKPGGRPVRPHRSGGGHLVSAPTTTEKA